MKTAVLAAILALAFAAAAGAIEPAPPPTLESLDREVQALTDQLRTATDDLAALRQRVADIEDRLGESYRGSSPFDTVERRLEELEKDVDDLERGR